MKKIMFYINAIHDGGAERVMINLADYFSRQGYKTILVTSFRDTWEYTVPNAVKRITLEEHEIKQSKLKRNITRVKKLRKFCKDEKPDILVSFMAEPNFRAILATWGLPVKTLISVRNDPNKEYAGRVGHIVGKYLLPFADGCVFQTKEAKNWFPKRLQKKSRIIYNSVKEDFYHVERHPVPGEIVTCGRLEEQKNHALLIAAFSKVVERYPEARLKIYGEGSLCGKLQKQIDALGLHEKAFLMGATNHVEKVLETADVFVLSSDFEGMPNALMEAMAAGVPCISTDCPCGGPRELFGDDLVKQLVKVDKEDELEYSISNFMELSEKDKMLLGKRIKEKAKIFMPDKVNEEWNKYISHMT
jgi:glycosyltransferase involved in cell wall biosynthesis